MCLIFLINGISLLQMVIDFTAEWCGPCKLIEPVIQEFAAKYTDVEFIKIDVDELMVSHSFLFNAIFLVM